jgi:Ser/Thr protein kinase RdoA (MazF antagonist)
MVNAAAALDFVLAEGIMTTDQVVYGRVQVTDISRRNCNFKVGASESEVLILKQADPSIPESCRTVDVEAAFYRLCYEHAHFESIRPLLPNLRHIANSDGVIVTEFVPQAVNLYEAVSESSENGALEAIGSLVGSALALVHATFRNALNHLEPHYLSFLTDEKPWLLRLHKPTPELFATMSRANLDIVRWLQARPHLLRGIDRSANAWQSSTVIHGDIRSANLLFTTTENHGANSKSLKLVDWELAQIGDPAWDLAHAYCEFVQMWLWSMTPAQLCEQMAASAQFPLQALQKAVGAVCSAYATSIGFDEVLSLAFSERSVLFCAAHLVQSAIELCQSSDTIPPHGMCLLQIAENIFADSRFAATYFLRIQN